MTPISISDEDLRLETYAAAAQIFGRFDHPAKVKLFVDQFIESYRSEESRLFPN